MTRAWTGEELAERLRRDTPKAVIEHDAGSVYVSPEAVAQVAKLLRDAPDLDFKFLSLITGVDFIEYFQVTYHLTSITHNAVAVVKTKLFGRDEPVVPSVSHLWRGADLMERETYDLMGIRFDGHPNMKRVLLWDGFPGNPLRKDFKGAGLPEGIEWARPNVSG